MHSLEPLSTKPPKTGNMSCCHSRNSCWTLKNPELVYLVLTISPSLLSVPHAHLTHLASPPFESCNINLLGHRYYTSFHLCGLLRPGSCVFSRVWQWLNKSNRVGSGELGLTEYPEVSDGEGSNSNWGIAPPLHGASLSQFRTTLL